MSVINIKVSADTVQAQNSLKALEARIARTEAAMAKMAAFRGPTAQLYALGQRGNGMFEGSAAMDVDLSSPIRQTELLVDKINKGKITQDEYKRAVTGTTSVIRQQMALQNSSIENVYRTSEGLRGSFRYGQEFSQQTDAYARSMHNLGNQLRVTGMAQAAYSQNLIDTGKNMAFSARQLTISLTAPLAITAAASIKAHADIEGSLTEIAKVYDLNRDAFVSSTEDVKEQARGVAKTLSDELSMKNQDTYGIQQFYAQQGVVGKGIEEMTRETGRLSLLGDVDTETAQNAVTTLTNVFRVNTEELGRYTNYMNAIEDATTLTMQDYADAMPKLGPLVTQFTEGPEEAMKTMSTMLEAGKRGGITSATEIANSIKSVYAKIAKPTEKLKDTWAELGAKNGLEESFESLNTKHAGDLLAVVTEIGEKTKDWSTADRAQLFAQLAGAEQVARFTTLVDQLAIGNERVADTNRMWDEQPDKIAEAAKAQEALINDTPYKQLTRLWNRIQNIGDSIGGEVFKPVMFVLNSMVSAVELIVSTFEKLPGMMKVMVGIAAVVAAAAGPAIGVLGAGIQLAGALQKIHAQNKARVGTALVNRFGPAGEKAGALLGTRSDKIMQVANEQHANVGTNMREREMAALAKTTAASEKLAESFIRLSTSVNNSSSRMNTATRTMGYAANQATGAIERAKVSAIGPEMHRRMNPEQKLLNQSRAFTPIPKQEVVMPEKPVRPKNLRGKDASIYNREMELYEAELRRAQQMQVEIDTQQAAAEQKQQRLQDRYQSYTRTVTEKPPTEAEYQKFHGDLVAKSSRNEKAIAARDTVSASLRQTNLDYAAAVNRGKSEELITRLKERQIRQQQALAGGYAKTSVEAARIATENQKSVVALGKMRTALPKFSGRTEATPYPDWVSARQGANIPLRDTRAIARFRKANPEEFRRIQAQAKFMQPGETLQSSIPVSKKNSQGMILTTDHADVMKRITFQQGELAKKGQAWQDKLSAGAEEYNQKIGMTITAVGMLTSMFGSDNKAMQWIGNISAGLGTVMLMIPSLGEKMVTGIGGVFGKIGTRISALAAAHGAKSGTVLGGSLLGAFAAKATKIGSFLKANLMPLMGIGLAIGAAVMLAEPAIEWLNKKTKEINENLDQTIARRNSYRDVFNLPGAPAQPGGYDPSEESSDEQQRMDQIRESLREAEGSQQLFDSLRGVQSRTELAAILRPEAIRILREGGTDADVSDMVKAALIESGADKATIDNFKLDVNVDDPNFLFNEMDQQSLGQTARGQANKKGFWGWLGTSLDDWGAFAGTDEGTERANYDVTTEKSAEVEFQKQQDALIAASAEARPEIAKGIAENLRGAIDDAKKMPLHSNERKYAEDFRRDLVGQYAGQYKGLSPDEGRNFNLIDSSDTMLSTVMAGKGASFTTASQQADAYKKAVQEAEAAGHKLSDAEKANIANLIRWGAGVDQVTYKVGDSADKWETFADAQNNIATGAQQTVAQMMSAWNGVNLPDLQIDPRDTDRLNAMNDALADAPPSFSRRYSFDMTIDSQGDVDGQVEAVQGLLQGAGEKTMDYAFSQAEAEFDRQAQASQNQIQQAGDAQLKALDNQQKASDKAFKNQEKALSNKHKAQSKSLDNEIKAGEKALDNRHKAQQKDFQKRQKDAKKQFDLQQREEKKQFDLKQREERKAFDKQQREEQKAFDKEIKADTKKFEESWDQREKALNGYYDGMKKVIEDQEDAEDKLDKARDRRAENERKRLEMLNELANSNVDINVALAGGDLDEAARLMNDASQTSMQYYDEVNQSDEQAQRDARKDRADKRLERIDRLQGFGSEVFGKQRESARERFDEGIDNRTEVFGDKQSDASEAFGDRQSDEAEKFGDRQADAADKFGERQAEEAETFQEQLDREKEEFQIRMEQRREQLQQQQELETEFLNAQKEAQAEYFAQQRESIQENTQASIRGSQETYESKKQAMANELALLKTEIPKNEQEVSNSVDRMKGIYNKYGISLDGISNDLQGNVRKTYEDNLEILAAQIRNDNKWKQVGESIGSMIRSGMFDGMDGSNFVEMLMTGKVPQSVKDKVFQSYSQGNRGPKPKGKATGGAIFGPGTGTSDDIPAMLSNGEHVLTAAEVAALGGHREVERMRAMARMGNLPGFATGGGVGKNDGRTRKPTDNARVGAEQSANEDGGVTITVSGTGAGGEADGGVINAVAADMQNFGQQFDETLTQTAAPSWQLFGDQMLQIKTDTIDPVFTGMQQAMSNTAAQMTAATTTQMTPAWQTFGSNLNLVKTSIWDTVMAGMNTSLTDLTAHTATSIQQHWVPNWTQGAQHVSNMHNQVISPTLDQTRQATNVTAQNFGTAADQIGVGWGRVKENTASPVRFTIGTVYNEGLVGMWNKLADKLDLKKFDPHPLNFATGGVLPGFTPGRDVHHFSSPTGGRLHLSGGEAIMRPEWTRAVGGPAAVNRLNAAARSGNLNTAQTGRFANGGVYGEDSNTFYGNNYDKLLADPHLTGHPAEQSHASGGIFLAPWADNHAFSGGPIPRSLYVVAKQVWPGFTNFSGYRPGDAQHGQNRALDIAHGSPTSTPQMRQMAATIADYYKEDTIQLIHHPFNRNIMQASNANVLGPSNFVGNGMAAYSPGTMMGHQNHVHWAAKRPVKPLEGRPIPPDPGGDGGDMAMGPMIDPAILAAYNEFTDEKNKLKERVEKFIKAAPDAVPSLIPGKVFAQVTKAMETKIQEAMPGIDGALSMGDYGGNAETYVKEIIAAAKERGLPAGAARIAIATALVESELRMLANPAVPESFKFPHDGVGYDHDSIGLFQQRQAGWGTTAQRMNARASAGMFFNRLTQFNWGAMDPGAAAQKVQVSAFPDKYATRMGHADALMARVGGFENANNADKPKAAPVADKAAPNKGAPNSWFDSGGLAQGKGYMPKDTVEPERVLSPQQTRAFDKMVDANFGSLGSSNTRTVAGPITNEEYMAKLHDFEQSQMYTPVIREKKDWDDDDHFGKKLLEMSLGLVEQMVQQVAIPGILKFTEDAMTIKTDADLAALIGKELADALVEDKLVSFNESNNESNMVINGHVYGDKHLNDLLEKYRLLILKETEARMAALERRVQGK